jgi:hypothetical protein
MYKADNDARQFEHVSEAAIQATGSRKRRFQFRLRTLMIAVTVIAVVLGLARLWGSLTDFLLGLVSVLLAIGLVQQARDLWRARSQLTECERSLIWGWRYAIGWRLIIALSICAYWIIRTLLKADLVTFEPAENASNRLDSAVTYRHASFFLTLIICLTAAPWVTWRRRGTAVSRVLNLLGVAAAIYIGSVVLRDITIHVTLVHIAIRGIQNAQPYKFAGQIISDIDVAAYDRSLHQLAYWSFGMIGVSLASIWLVRLRTRSVLLRTLIVTLLLAGIAASARYAVWVHGEGLHGVSPILAQSQIPAPWAYWFFAGLLVLLFAASAAFRICYRTPDESRQPIIVWHRGSRAYLHENRIVLISLAVVLFWGFIDAASYGGLLNIEIWASFLMWPHHTYLPIAALWLAVHGSFARRNIPDLDRRMTPVPVTPVDFVITTILVAAVTVGLVEAVTWSSFTLWLI